MTIGGADTRPVGPAPRTGRPSPTTPSGSSPGCSTSTGSSGSTSPTPSCSSEDADGHPTEAFTPDFYLPDFDLYLEITTLKQTLVTKKNRKVRELLERYPDVDVEVLYQRTAARPGGQVRARDAAA